MVKKNYIVFSGGPGSGKSSLLDYLQAKGFSVVREVARSIIRERKLEGLSPRPGAKEFAENIFLKDLAAYHSKENETGFVFFDRCLCDSACMLHLSGHPWTVKARNDMKTMRFRSPVFMFPPWKEIYTKDEDRDQEFDEACAVYIQLQRWYLENDYALEEVPLMPVETRAEWMLKRIGIYDK